MPSKEQKLIAILQYLEDWDRLARSPVLSVRKYSAGFVAFEAEIRGLPYVANNVTHDGEDIWLEIKRVQRIPPPAPSENLQRWVTLVNDPNREPRMREFIELAQVNPDEEPEKEFPSDEIVAAFEVYRDGTWRSWSESEIPRRKSISLYEQLFHLQQTIEHAGTETPLEIVWGMGMAVWRTEQGLIEHPLITQQVELMPLEGDMTLRVRPTSLEPQIEADPFLPLELPELTLFEKNAKTFLQQAEIVPSPFELSTFEGIARSGAERLDTGGVYWPDDESYRPGEVPEPRKELIVTDSWVLFARNRSSSFLVQDLKELQQAITEDGVPEGPARHLVELPQGIAPPPLDFDFRGLSQAGSGGERETRDLYFPKPFNDEQVEILRRLETSPGVIVQGPPGTGKTHTIGNIICHFLAMGKRVLVTSKGEAALSVLQQQIPEQIRPLTVSLLTSERDGKEQLERSVQQINAKLAEIQPRPLESEIEGLEQQIDGLHAKIAYIDSQLREWARKNTVASPQSIGGLPPEDLARRVANEEAIHQWFPDELNAEDSCEPSFSDEEIAELASIRSDLGDKIEYAQSQLPTAESFVTATSLASVHDSLLEQGNLNDQIGDLGALRLSSHDEVFLQQARELLHAVREHRKLIAHCRNEWLTKLRQHFREGHHSPSLSPVAGAMLEILNEIESLERRFAPFVATAIDFEDEWHADPALPKALDRAVEGKRPFSLVRIGSKMARERFDQIRINGSRPCSSEEWKTVLEFCSVQKQGKALILRWNKLRTQIEAPEVNESDPKRFEHLIQHAATSKQAKLLGINYDLTLVDRVREVFPQLEQDRIRSDDPFLEKLENALQIQLRRLDLVEAKRVAAELSQKLEGLDGSLFNEAADWIRSHLGAPTVGASESENHWQGFLDQLQALTNLETRFSRAREITETIGNSGASSWAKRLLAEPVLEGDDPLIPSHWRKSWTWSRQRGYLEQIDGRSEVLELARDRRDAESRLQRSYEKLVEQRTWLRLYKELSTKAEIKRAITAYVQAIRRMTKSGKGKRDVSLRKAAREAMTLASRGVPCWIMPHWRISEALPPRLGDFDLVIIDEASQSDAWAVPALIRGKQVLIVGDDKQVGPSVSFLKEEQTSQILERLRSAGLTTDILRCLHPSDSIYDLGELIFSGQTIRLREHFRCAEAIIEFSNKLCYNGEIKCVRVPDATERLLPTLVDVHVRTGRRDSRKKINRAEAEAIVDEIESLVNDPEFKDRSIGVVSLLGADQARYIMDELIERIGEEKYLTHEIRCGDARTFQGSEADVIFLSAVDDADSGGVMTSNRMENVRRMNVAASRARDRLYYFHSFSRDDLSGVDLRGRLLDHFREPLAGLPEGHGRDLCESPFEREMFDELVKRGYRVLPQVRVGNYRIDFVIEGHQGRRLAVECDGDQFHGPDRWMEDIGRQRVLERAGWKFWRCWGSSFYADREACLEDLVSILDSESIEPIGSGEVDYAGLVEFREVVPPEDPEDSEDPEDPEDPENREFEEDTVEEAETADDIDAEDANDNAWGQTGNRKTEFEGDTTPDEEMDSPPGFRPTETPPPEHGEANVAQGDLFEQPLSRDDGQANDREFTVSVGHSIRYRMTDESGRVMDETIILTEAATNLARGLVNVESPLGQSFLGRRVGEPFSATPHRQRFEYEILEIQTNSNLG